jgi:hypothetical protein
MLVEVLVGVQKKNLKYFILFSLLKVAGPAEASRRAFWPAAGFYNDIPGYPSILMGFQPT